MGVAIAVNTPAEVDIHLNDLGGRKVGVADMCAFDHASVCTGTVDATENYWGCPDGPGGPGCAASSGSDIRFTPWLEQPLNNGDQDDHGHGDHHSSNLRLPSSPSGPPPVNGHAFLS